MSRYAFLRTSRWIGVALLAVLVATACVLLGVWQWNRHEDRAAGNDLVNTNYDRPPAALEEVLDGSEPVRADDVWRRVRTSGTYVGDQVLVRNRPVAGTAAARVLAVLRTDGPGTAQDDEGGRLVVVDRGWVPLGDEEAVAPDYPDGEVQLVGRLRQAEAPDSRTAPDGQVYAIEPGTVLEATGAGEVTGAEGAPVLEGYLVAAEEDPAPAQELAAFPRPETTPGSHLSYAFQWWVFALGALVGFVVLARREAAETAGDPVRTDRRRRTDADVEDALIDAQLRET